MPKYLITGVAGFIGSNIAHALIARGEQVRGIDDLSHGRRENVAGLLNQFDFREADITDLPSIRSACEGVDYVLHQAALGSVPRSLDNPLASNHANVVGTLSVLQAAREYAREAVEAAKHTQNQRLIARAYVWRGLTSCNSFFNDTEDAKNCCDAANSMLRAVDYDDLWEVLRMLIQNIILQ